MPASLGLHVALQQPRKRADHTRLLALGIPATSKIGYVMLFIVQFEDVYIGHPARLADRATHMDAHLAFLAALGNHVVASGALRESEDGPPLGGIWLVNAQTKAEVEAWVLEDPFWKAGLRKSFRVCVWSKAVWSPAFADCIDLVTST